MSVESRSIKKTPNDVLREERLRRAWTQQDLADQIGTSVGNISRWERGITSPGPYFRQQLTNLFEKDIEALGLLPSIPGAKSNRYPSCEESASLTPQEKPEDFSYRQYISFPGRRFSLWQWTLVVGVLIIVYVLIVNRSFIPERTANVY